MSLKVAEAYRNVEWGRHCFVYKHNGKVKQERVDFMMEVMADPQCCSYLFYMKFPGGWREFEGIHPCNYSLFDKEDLWYYMSDGILRQWKHLTNEWRLYVCNLFKAAEEDSSDWDPEASDDDVNLDCESDEEDVVCLGAAPLKKRKVETVDLTDE